MVSSNRLPFTASHAPGYRLDKLEVFNWGTFDGQVYTCRPAGKSALLIGQNGSGKSTLVDALLTLLVRPGMRNFNVAAGGKKRERDERTYLRGAYDRGADETGEGAQLKYLRPKGDQYSVILATFRNADVGKSFTVAQFLYLSSDQSVEKIYCMSENERSIRDDFSGLTATDEVLKTLRKRDFRVTRTFQEFERWFARQTHTRPKAMEVFNQTVAVKDIPRLNDFIREHMLEPRDWNDKVDRLLVHFFELSEAHASLVRVRKQRDLLEPISKFGNEYSARAEQLERVDNLLSAIDAYFSQAIVKVFTPALAQHEADLVQTGRLKDSLDMEISQVGEEIHSLRNQIENAGGDRLRQLPALIDVQKLRLENKQVMRTRVQEALKTLGLRASIDSPRFLTETQQQLVDLRESIETELPQLAATAEGLQLERGDVRRNLGSCRHELECLSRRRENIPQWCVALREQVCKELGLAARDLPFAAELMAVAPAEKQWESSIEKVLRSFALSMLVPEKYYQLLTKHLEGRRLEHEGRGQRLIYLRVADIGPNGDAAIGSNSLIAKLHFRDGHSLLPWLKAELLDRFDYRCCADIEEFRECRGLAMTVNRHVKSGSRRHDKDDREAVVDPRNFVLGWDNREKRERLRAEVERLTQQESQLTIQIAETGVSADNLRGRLQAVAAALSVGSFEEIDVGPHEQEIGRLEAERCAILENSDVIRLLRKHRDAAEARQQALKSRRDHALTRESELRKEIYKYNVALDAAKAELHELETAGQLQLHSRYFAELDAEFADSPFSTEDVVQRKDKFRSRQESLARRLRDQLRPTQITLLDSMSRYLQSFPEAAGDLHVGVEYLESLNGLRQRIDEDDLPRHEQRFKERLNQKVIEEIGFFRNELEKERRDIQNKIELLNSSLKKLEYRPGTHIQLEPRPIRDPEIAEFQQKLRQCIEGSFEDSSEANEARFLRIQDLVIRLRDEANRRWREKVTDVRRWFDFVATVVDRQSSKIVSVYQDTSGQSGGEKAKLAFTILVAAIAYQYDLDPDHPASDRFHFVVVDEMFSKVDDQYAEYALELFKQFGLQLLIVAPLDAKARVTQPYVGSYLHVVKKDNRSAIYEMSAREFEGNLARHGDLVNAGDLYEP